MRKKLYICTNCGYEGTPVSYTPGSYDSYRFSIRTKITQRISR